MGLAICKKHGESGVIGGISLDICQDVQNGKNEIKGIVIIKIDVFDGDEFLYTEKNYVSSKIFNDRRLSKKYTISDEGQENTLNDLLPPTSGMCGRCFED